MANFSWNDWGSWLPELVGTGFVGTLLGWFTNHKVQSADARKKDAETLQINEGRGATFEQAINERTRITIDALQRQVELLTRLVESQNGKIDAQTKQLMSQTEHIETLQSEIKDLRKAYDKTTRELHQLKFSKLDEEEEELSALGVIPIDAPN